MATIEARDIRMPPPPPRLMRSGSPPPPPLPAMYPTSLCDLGDGEFASGHAGTNPSAVRIWNARTGEHMHILGAMGAAQRHLAPVIDVCNMGAGTLISSDREGHIIIWNYNSTPAFVSEITHAHPPCSVRLCKMEDTKFAAGGADGVIKILSRSGDIHNTLSSEGDPHAILCICYCNQSIVTGATDNTIRIWKKDFDTNTWAIEQRLIGHVSSISAICCINHTIVSADMGGIIQIWRLDGTVEHTMGEATEAWPASQVNTLCPLYGGRIASGHEDGKVRIWKIANGEFWDSVLFEADPLPVTSICQLADNVIAIAKGNNNNRGTIYIRHIAPLVGGRRRSRRAKRKAKRYPKKTRKGHKHHRRGAI